MGLVPVFRHMIVLEMDLIALRNYCLVYMLHYLNLKRMSFQIDLNQTDLDNSLLTKIIHLKINIKTLSDNRVYIIELL